MHRVLCHKPTTYICGHTLCGLPIITMRRERMLNGENGGQMLEDKIPLRGVINAETEINSQKQSAVVVLSCVTGPTQEETGVTQVVHWEISSPSPRSSMHL